MISIVRSAVCIGINACPISVEVDVSAGLPQFNVVGLPDQSLKESKERVRSAIKNSGFPFPPDRITINLAPAELKKEGSAFDLPIALGILAAAGVVKQETLNPFLFLGELALDGSLRAVKGAIAVASELKKSGAFIFPSDNTAEARLEKEAAVYGLSSLTETVRFLNGETELHPVKHDGADPDIPPLTQADFSEVKGQSFAKRAIEIAVTGGHNLLLMRTQYYYQEPLHLHKQEYYP